MHPRGGVTRQRKDLLPALPGQLGFQLEIFLKRDLFLRTPFFQNSGVKLVLALVPLVRSEHMMPGRIFARIGGTIDGLYLVARGKVLLQIGNGQQVGVRFAGGFVGEDALAARAPVPAKFNCMCGDWTELHLLKASDFLTLAKNFPELQQRMAVYNRGKESKKDVLREQEQQLRMNEDNNRNRNVTRANRGSVLSAVPMIGGGQGRASKARLMSSIPGGKKSVSAPATVV